jgi:hypothetical protein
MENTGAVTKTDVETRKLLAVTIQKMDRYHDVNI